MVRNYTYAGPSGKFVLGDTEMVNGVSVPLDEEVARWLTETYPQHTWMLTGDDEAVAEPVHDVPKRVKKATDDELPPVDEAAS